MATKTITGIKAGTTTITASFEGKTSSVNFTVSAITPTLSFSATSGTITYDGNRKAIGTVSYNGDGTAYYLVNTSSTVPSADSTAGTGWVSVSNGGTVYATKSGVASQATTYYVFLKSVAGTNYTAVSPKSGGSKAIGQASGSVTTAPTDSNATYASGSYLCSAGSGTGTMYYKLSGGSYSTTRPTTSGLNAGSYTLYYYAAASDNYTQSSEGSITVTVAKASGNITAPTNSAATYGSGSYLCSTGSSSTGTIYYKLGSGSYSTTRPTTSGLNAGSYTLYYYAAASTNYNATSEANITVTVVQAGGGVSISNANPTYGTSNNLASVSGATGTMYYRLGTSGSFSTTMPTASGLNAGSYTLYYYVAASTNYTAFGSSSSPKSLEVSVAKASGSVKTAPANNGSTYGSGNYLCTTGASDTGTMQYKLGSGSYSSTRPTTSGLNAGSYTLYYYAAASTNYNASSEGSITVTVVQAGGGVTISNANPTYGTSNNLASVSGATGTMHYKLDSGSWTTTIPTATTSVGGGSHTLYYYVDASTNYTAFGSSGSPKSLTVTVAKANQSAPSVGTPTAITYGSGTLTGSYSGGGGQGTLYYKADTSGGTNYGTATTSAPTRSSAGTTTYIAYWSGNDNYNASPNSSQGQLVVNKATPTMSLSNTDVIYHNTASIKATASVAGTVYWGTTSSTSGMTNTQSVSANTATELTTRTNLGSTTVYAYFVPTDTSNYNSLGSSSDDHTSKTMTVSQASDASVSVTPAGNAGTYGSSATLVTAANSSSHGTSAAYVGYKLGEATADSQITWVSVGNILSLETSASAGTYYIYKKWTADSNHSNSSNYTQVTTLTRSKATGSGSVTMTGWTYGGSVTNPTPSSSTNGTSNVTYTWYDSNKTELGSKPGSTSTAGTYYVKATFATTTNYNAYTTDYVSFSISKATGSGSVTMTGWAYGGTVTNPTPSSSTNGTSNVTYTWYDSNKSALGSKPTSTSAVGTYYVKATFAEVTNYNAYTTDYVSFSITQRTGAAPTFNASSVSATCVQTGSAVNAGAFTAATAGHSGSITYDIQGVVKDGTSTQLTNWTVNSSRVITVPESTKPGTYNVTIRANEAQTSTDTSSYKDAVITVTLSKGSQTLNLNKDTLTLTVPNTGTITASGYAGTLNVTSSTPGVATASNEATSTITAVSAGNTTNVSGTSTITFTAASTDYVNEVSKTATVTVNRRTGANPSFSASDVVATCSQNQSAKTTTAFTTATAGHGGTISYSLVSAKDSEENTLSGWSVDSSNRTIGIPANTVSGTYSVSVKASESQTSTDTASETPAIITVTLNKGTQTLNLDKSTLQLTVPNTGTITASGYVGTLNVTSSSSSIATASNEATSTITAVSAGTVSVTFIASANDYVNTASTSATVTVIRRNGAKPTFNNSPVTATCSQDQTSKVTTAFTAATAGHGGNISYELISVTDSLSTSLSGWTLTSSTRNINIPADTIAGTYTCIVRANEGETSTDTSSYKDATITVTLSKGIQTLILTGNPVDYTTTYNDGGTITASGHVGTISAISGTTTVATVSTSNSTVTVTCVKAGTTSITVSASGNDYVNAVSETITWTINKADSILPTNWKGDSKSYHNTARLTVSGYSGGSLKYRYDEANGTNWTETTTAPTRTAIGNTAVQCMVVGDDNHKNSEWSSTVTLTINQASDAMMEVDTYDRTYSGSAQVIAGLKEGTDEGIATYYLGYYKSNSEATAENEITWGTANSSLSATDAGEYQIYYKFTSDANHSNNKLWTYVGAITIGKASRSGVVSCSDTTYPETVTATVSGNTENGTITWGITPGTGTATINSSGVVTPTSAGTVTVTASISETSNYLAYVATSKEIEISKVSLGSIAKPSNAVYTGSAFTPTPVVTATVGGVSTELVLNTDYTLSYTNNTNVGQATVTATGIGNFYGTVYETWNITGAAISVTAPDQNYTYDSNFHGTGITVETVNSQEYEIRYRTTSSGEYNLTSYPAYKNAETNVVYYQVTADNHITYTGSYQIIIAPFEVTLAWGMTSWMYDGNEHQTTCTVTNLIGSDTCDVILSNNSITDIGTETVTATGLSNSNYILPSSNLTRTLTINPGVFVKLSNTWKPIKKVYMKESGSWVEQNINSVFNTSEMYIKK